MWFAVARKIKAIMPTRKPTTVKSAFSIHVYSNIEDNNAEVCHELKPDEVFLSVVTYILTGVTHTDLLERLQEENYL